MSMNPPNINAENLPLEPGYRWVDIANEPWIPGVQIHCGPPRGWSAIFTGGYDPGWSYRVKEEARPSTPAKPEPDTEDLLFPGAKVSKTGGDYRFDGTVIGVFKKLSGVIRYAVEDDRGVVHIYSRKNLTPRG